LWFEAKGFLKGMGGVVAFGSLNKRLGAEKRMLQVISGIRASYGYKL